MLEGGSDIFKNLQQYEADGRKAAERGVHKAAIATASHIQREYRRNTTGKGFDNVSGLLRSSIRGVLKVVGKKIYGYIVAGTGSLHYAPYVEFRWGGKFAYLWPGVKDMTKKIFVIINTELKGIIK